MRGVKTQIAGPNLRVSDSVELRWAREPPFLTSVNSGADTDAGGPGTPLWEPLPTLEEQDLALGSLPGHSVAVPT